MKTRIFWDTNLFVYLLHRALIFFETTVAMRTSRVKRDDELITSSMTQGEIRVWPRRSKNPSLVLEYRETIRKICTVVPFDDAAADIFAVLREDPSMQPPDANQLSCAAAAGVGNLLTNDLRLHRLRVPGFHFVTGLDRPTVLIS